MKIVNYCNHCHELFHDQHERWFKVYKSIVENMVENNQPSLYFDIFNDWVGDLLKLLEKEELIITTEYSQNIILVFPICITTLEFEGTQGIEYYHVCSSLRDHEALVIDEKVEEE